MRDRTAAEPPVADSHAGRVCARCGAAVRWREVKFCLDHRNRFGGRVYCLPCQRRFPVR